VRLGCCAVRACPPSLNLGGQMPVFFLAIGLPPLLFPPHDDFEVERDVCELVPPPSDTEVVFFFSFFFFLFFFWLVYGFDGGGKSWDFLALGRSFFFPLRRFFLLFFSH